MNQSLNDMLNKVSREQMHGIWQIAKSGKLDDLNDEEKQLAEIMLEHQDEYYNDFEFADVTHERKYDPDSETNPFLHITFHSIVENQLKNREPIETYQFYNAMLRKGMQRHDVIHLIGRIVSGFLFMMMKHNIEFDVNAYKSILKECKKSNINKVWETFDAEFNRLYPE